MSERDLPRLPRLPSPRQAQRPPKQRVPPVLPRGPRLYLPGRRKVIRLGGPGTPPAGFIGSRNSRSEWIWYWASMRRLDPDRNPRTPPFTGGRFWTYQTFVQGLSQQTFRQTNVDFIYGLSDPPLVVRIQTYRYHTSAPAWKQAYDDVQLIHLLGRFSAIDVYESDFMADETGQAAIKLLIRTLGLERGANPLAAGTVRVVRGYA